MVLESLGDIQELGLAVKAIEFVIDRPLAPGFVAVAAVPREKDEAITYEEYPPPED